MNGGSGADFMIHGIVKYHLFGHELWLTTTTVGMTIVTIVLLILVIAANRALKHATDVPGTFQNIIEFGMEMLENMTTGILGSSANRFANYIGTIFLFILFCNLSGLFGLRTVTADFGVTFLLGLVTFAIVQYQGIKNHGVGHFTGLFQPLPVLFPINLIGEFANPISISLRLFANMLSGVIIMGLWYGMMPVLLKIGIPAALQCVLRPVFRVHPDIRILHADYGLCKMINCRNAGRNREGRTPSTQSIGKDFACSCEWTANKNFFYKGGFYL